MCDTDGIDFGPVCDDSRLEVYPPDVQFVLAFAEGYEIGFVFFLSLFSTL